MNNCYHIVEKLNLLSTYHQTQRNMASKFGGLAIPNLKIHYTGRQEGEQREVNQGENDLINSQSSTAILAVQL